MKILDDNKESITLKKIPFIVSIYSVLGVCWTPGKFLAETRNLQGKSNCSSEFVRFFAEWLFVKGTW